MSIEDNIEDLKDRLETIERCVQDSDDFNELRACLKPITQEEAREAIARAAIKRTYPKGHSLH